MGHLRKFLCIWLVLFCLSGLLPAYPAHADSPAAAGAYPHPLGKSALLMDAASGRVLYEMNSHQRLSPASVTKIMTGLLVVENGDLDKVVTVSEHAAATPESAIWLEAGEKLTREELLYASLVNSANDASVALAESVAGSEEAFVELMNRRAEELGMKDTHFQNPHGLEADGHYTSAYDLALVGREAMKHAIFRQVAATKTKNIPWAQNDYARLLINKNRLLWRYDHAIGIKTGYTKIAGNCAVGAAQRGSMTLIAVSLNSTSVYQDLQQILDYGFARYTMQTVKKSSELSVDVPVLKGRQPTVPATPTTDLSVAVTEEEKSQVTYTVHTDDQVTAPVRKGQVLGSCSIEVAGNEASRVNLLAGSAVAAKPSLLSRIKPVALKVILFILKALLAIFCLGYLIRIFNLTRRRLRNRKNRKTWR